MLREIELCLLVGIDYMLTNSYSLPTGTDPVVGQAGLEPPYRWKSNGAPLSLPYNFEEGE
jgi:hypothetical protein